MEEKKEKINAILDFIKSEEIENSGSYFFIGKNDKRICIVSQISPQEVEDLAQNMKEEKTASLGIAFIRASVR